MKKSILYQKKIPTLAHQFREVAEWFKAHAWKACWVQALEGSNPFLSAKQNPAKVGFFIFKSTQVHLWGFKKKKDQAAKH